MVNCNGSRGLPFRTKAFIAQAVRRLGSDLCKGTHQCVSLRNGPWPKGATFVKVTAKFQWHPEMGLCEDTEAWHPCLHWGL